MNCLLQIFHNFKIVDSANSYNAADCTQVRSAERKGSRKASSINQNTLKPYRRCCFIEYFQSAITGLSLSCGFPFWGCRTAMSYQFDRKNISHRTLKFNMKRASGVWEGCSLAPKRIVHIDTSVPQVVVASLAFFQLSPKQGGGHRCLWPLV